MLKPFIKSVFALFLLLQPFSAGAYVVQNSQSALSFNNVSRSIAASSSAAQSSGKKTSEGKVFDDKVDYEEISAKLFDKSSRKVYIDLSQNSTKNISEAYRPEYVFSPTGYKTAAKKQTATANAARRAKNFLRFSRWMNSPSMTSNSNTNSNLYSERPVISPCPPFPDSG